jgi:hypothetical protein
VPRIRPNDPTRDHLHDYLVYEVGKKGEARLVAAYDTSEEAQSHLASIMVKPGVFVLRVMHPDGCECADAP